MGSAFRELVVLEDLVKLENLAYFADIKKSFLIVRRDFEIPTSRLSYEPIDLGFKMEAHAFRNDDFYSIPLIYSDVCGRDPCFVHRLWEICKEVEEVLSELGVNLRLFGSSRFLVGTNFEDSCSSQSMFEYKFLNCEVCEKEFEARGYGSVFLNQMDGFFRRNFSSVKKSYKRLRTPVR